LKTHPRQRSLVAPATNASGITLIEVLISLLILSLAVVGIAGLQTYTTRYQLGIYNRTALSPLLNDLSARMRSNLIRVPGYSTSLSASSPSMYNFEQTWSSQATIPAAPSTTKLCGTESGAVTCDAAEKASYDLWAWRRQVRETMPRGSVYVTGDINAGMTVTFMWSDKDNTTVDGSDAAASQSLRGVSACTAVSVTGKDVVNGQASLDQQTCCPAAASAVAGVRCANFTVLP